jgi:hypothetical protein
MGDGSDRLRADFTLASWVGGVSGACLPPRAEAESIARAPLAKPRFALRVVIVNSYSCSPSLFQRIQ